MKKSHSVSTMTRDFNARFKNWWFQCITNSQGSIIGTLTSISGYHQIINSLTYITNTSSSCIDLVFISNTSVMIEFSVGKISYSHKYYHSIVSDKMNLRVPLPPPNTPEIWDYNNTDRKNIQRSINTFN